MCICPRISNSLSASGLLATQRLNGLGSVRKLAFARHLVNKTGKLLLGAAGLCLFVTFLCPQNALAHRAYLFAWTELDQICGNAYYSKTRPLRQAKITVLNANKAVLLTASADEQGHFCLARPDAGPLLLLSDAQDGHRAEYHLPAQSAAPVPLSSGTGAEAETEAGVKALVEMEKGVTGISPDALRLVIREELGKLLPPLLDAALEKNAASEREYEKEKPALRDIVGGLGWIVGLTALWFWMRKRRAS